MVSGTWPIREKRPGPHSRAGRQVSRISIRTEWCRVRAQLWAWRRRAPFTARSVVSAAYSFQRWRTHWTAISTIFLQRKLPTASRARARWLDGIDVAQKAGARGRDRVREAAGAPAALDRRRARKSQSDR